MTIVFIILTLAWSIGTITSELGTAEFLVDFAKNTTSPIIIPALLFIFGSFFAFTTGTSYGRVALMIPIAIPLAHSLDMSIAMTIAAVLSGGIFGDHCSPISDTTILSSAGAASDHIDHVNRQIPYAITAGICSIAAYLVAGATSSALIGLAVGIIVLVIAVYLLS